MSNNVNKNNISILNILKVISAIFIAFFYHYSLNGQIPFFSFIGRIGCSSVAFFFMISGFLLFYNYSHKQTKILYFCGKRINKFYLTYLISLILCIIACFFFKRLNISYTDIDVNAIDFSFRAIIRSIFCVSIGWVNSSFNANAPSWFFCVLIICYILFIIILAIRNSELKRTMPPIFSLLFAGILFAASIVGLVLMTNYPFFYWQTTCYGVAAFSLGILLCQLYLLIKNKKYIWILSIPLLVILITYYILLYIHGGFTIFDSSQVWTRNLLLINVCFTSLFTTIAFSLLQPFEKYCSVKPVQYICKMSDNLYFFHWFFKVILIVIGNQLLIIKYGTIGNYVIYIIVTIAFVWVYTYLLLPLINRGINYICKRIKKRPEKAIELPK